MEKPSGSSKLQVLDKTLQGFCEPLALRLQTDVIGSVWLKASPKTDFKPRGHPWCTRSHQAVR